MTHPLITGEESWIDTPAGRSWKAAFAGCPEPFRWSPEQVATAILKAHEIVAAEAGRVGPSGAGGGGVFRMASSGLPEPRFLPYEVTWAQSVVLWPVRYLLDEHDPARRQIERKAVRIWIRRETGDRLDPGERALYKTRAHRLARKRGLVLIAAGLMRDRVRHPEAAEPVDQDDIAIPISDDPPPVAPSPRAWRAPEPQDECDAMPDVEGLREIASAIAADAAALRGDREAIVSKLARDAAQDWFVDHPQDTTTMTRRTKLATRLKAAALAVLREASPA